MTEYDEKIYECFKLLLNFKKSGANDNEILEVIKCYLEHGIGEDLALLQLRIDHDITYRQTSEFHKAQYARLKEERANHKAQLKRIDELLDVLSQHEQQPT